VAKPLTIFGDPIMGTLAALRARMPDFDASAAFGTKEPTPAADGSPQRPYGMVAVDRVTGTYPALAIATVRVTIWHTSEHAALQLAMRARAVLLSYEGNADVRHYGELTGPIPTTDPDTKSPLCSFTVAARLRPIPLEEQP
jgi:hypothetical protein